METIEEIKKLALLLKDGAITQAEFDALKKNIFSSMDKTFDAKSQDAENVIIPKKKIANKKTTVKNNSQKPKKEFPKNQDISTNEVSGNNDKYARYIKYLTLLIIAIGSFISGINSKTPTTFLVVLIIFVTAYFVTQWIFRQSLSKLKTSLYLTIIPLIFLIGVLLPEEQSSPSSSPSSSSSSESSSGDKYCAKHDRMYNINNAWKGCPDCVQEEDQKRLKNALEKSRHL